MNKRIQIILLLMLLCLASCGSTTEDPKGTDTSIQDTTATETDPLATVPVQDLGGYTCTLYSSDLFDNFSIGEENGDVLNDGIYRRDLAVSERLHLTFEYQTNSRDDLPKNVSNAVMAGDDVYDIVFSCFANNGVTLLQGGNLIDLNTVANFDFTKDHWSKLLTDELTYNDRLYFTSGDIVPTFFQYEKPWYNQATNEAMTLNGKNFVMLGATDISAVGYAYCMYMNLDEAANIGIPDIYDTVNAGEWTYDVLLEYTEAYARDTDGNGIMEDGDFYGYATRPGDIPTFMWAFEADILSVSDDGVVDILFGDEKTVAVAERVSKLYKDNPNVSTTGSQVEYDGGYVFNGGAKFVEDQALIASGFVKDSISPSFLEYEADYADHPLSQIRCRTGRVPHHFRWQPRRSLCPCDRAECRAGGCHHGSLQRRSLEADRTGVL